MRALFEPLRWIGTRTVVFCALLVALELGLYHLGDYGKWVVQEQTARLGWRMLPNQDGWSRHYDVRERINAQGFRDDRDWGRPARDPNRLRIAVLGNSMTYGTSVPVEETWPRVLERQIQAALDAAGDPRRAQVLNFAVQGYTFEQMARLYEDRVRAWSPDVLLWPTIAPDIRPMRPASDDPDYGFRELVIRTATYDMLRDHVIHKWIPRAAPPSDPTDRDATKQRLWEAVAPALESTLIELYGDALGATTWQVLGAEIRRALAEAPAERAAARIFKTFEPSLPATPPLDPLADPVLALWSAFESHLTEDVWQYLDTTFKQAPYSPQNQFLWTVRGRRLVALTRDLEARGGRLFLLALPTMARAVQGSPSPGVYWNSVWRPAAEDEGLTPVFFDPQLAFVEAMPTLVAEVRRRDYVDGGKTKIIGEDYLGAERSLVLLDDPGHYSSAGHALLGESVQRALAAAGWLEERP